MSWQSMLAPAPAVAWALAAVPAAAPAVAPSAAPAVALGVAWAPAGEMVIRAGPPEVAATTPRASPRAIGTASGTISCARDRRAGRGRRRGRRRRVFRLAFPLQVRIPSTSVHSVYLEGDVRPVPARCGRKAGKSFCRL